MNMKTCFKCLKEKPLESFYKHGRMADGRFNKCIDCAIVDAHLLRLKNIGDKEWLESERARCRVKQQKYRNGGGRKRVLKHRITWRKKHPEKRSAHHTAYRAVKNGLLHRVVTCESCGVVPSVIHKHHPDYTKPLEVDWLCPLCHGKRHRKLQSF